VVENVVTKKAEVYAILTCANSLQSEQNASIAMCSDSQAALKALQSSKTTSSLVAETKSALKRLSIFNSVRLLWVPGHSNIPGNEVADVLAKQAATSAFVGPESAIGINTATVSTETRRWANTASTSLGVSCRLPPVQTIPQRPRQDGTICTGP